MAIFDALSHKSHDEITTPLLDMLILWDHSDATKFITSEEHATLRQQIANIIWTGLYDDEFIETYGLLWHILFRDAGIDWIQAAARNLLNMQEIER